MNTKTDADINALIQQRMEVVKLASRYDSTLLKYASHTLENNINVVRYAVEKGRKRTFSDRQE